MGDKNPAGVTTFLNLDYKDFEAKRGIVGGCGEKVRGATGSFPQVIHNTPLISGPNLIWEKVDVK
jgi:hypothetical protein